MDDRLAPLTMTDTTVAVLRELLRAPDEQRTAADLSKVVHVPAGPLGLVLGRLADAGWITATVRPRKVRLTAAGVDAARAAVADYQPPAEMTLPQLRRAVENGDVQPSVLEAVLRQLA